MFEKNKHGFWRQTYKKSYTYTEEYKKKQSTNTEMSYLRLGWLTSYFNYDKMKEMTIVDVGCGTGIFAQTSKKFFKVVEKYDVTGESITKEELYTRKWDLIVLSDVLEHFEDIEDLFKMNWKYAFISFPETPNVERWEELQTWRHFKPDEHLWCLNLNGMKNWLEDRGCKVLGDNNFEDFIRTRQYECLTNISSLLVRKDYK